MAITRLAFQLQDGDNYLDIAKALSAHHRTLVRQKQIFTVMGGMIVDDPANAKKNTVSTAPNTWYTRAAVNRCFKAWKDMRSKTLANAVDTNGTGKYADFKVLLNSGGSGSYRSAIATGVVGDRPALATREWTYSTLESESGDSVAIQIVGDHSNGRYSATSGWVQTRAIPETNEPTMPDVDGDGTLDYKNDFVNNLHDTGDGQSERMSLVYEENDDTPFHLNELYAETRDQRNLQLQCLSFLSDNNPHAMIPGFEALCGLVYVHVESGSSQPIIFLDVESRGRNF